MAVAEGVSVFTVGVGTGAALLNSLATVATEPVCDHQLRVDQFQHLKDIIQETQFKICKGESCIHLDHSSFSNSDLLVCCFSNVV